MSDGAELGEYLLMIAQSSPRVGLFSTWQSEAFQLFGSPGAHAENRPSYGPPPFAMLQPCQNCTPLSGPPFQVHLPSVSLSCAPIHTFRAT